jgi:hypothetical protein
MFDQQTAYQQWLGLIPAANLDLSTRPNHYQLLGLQDFEPSIPVISKAAEDKLSKILAIKPESNRPLWQRIVNELAEAQSILTHPEHKAEYDSDLRKKSQPTVEPALAYSQPVNHAGSEQFPASYSPSVTAMTPSQPNPQQYPTNIPQAVPVNYATPANGYTQTAPQYSQAAPQYAQPYQQMPQAVPQYGQPVAPQPYGYDPYAQPGNYGQPQYAAPVYQAQPYAPPAAMPVAPPSYPQYGMPVAPPTAHDPGMNYGAPAYGAPNPMAPVAVPQAAPNPMAPLTMQHSNTHGSFAAASQMSAVNSHAEATPVVSGRSYRRQQSSVGIVLAALIGIAFVAGLAVFMATKSQDDQSKQQAKNTNTNKVSKPAPATPVSTPSVTTPAEPVTPPVAEPKVKPEPIVKPEVVQPQPMAKPVPAMPEMPVKPEVSMPAQPEPSMPAAMPAPMTPETKPAPQPMPAEPKPMPETMAKPAMPAPMPTPMPTPEPMPVKATPEQTKAFYAKLVEIRDLLGRVDFVTADKELLAVKKLAISEELDNDLASMELMRDYTKEFWRIIKGATKGLEGELQLKTTIVNVISANEDKIVIRMEGTRREFKINEMPLGLTAAIARKVFNEQPASKAAMGAYCFVTKGAPIEECDNLWNQANGGGVDCKPLQSLLKRPEFKR